MRALNWDCADCGESTIPEYYMLHNRIWLSVAGKREMLCIGCVERRLGRRLVKGDFTGCLANKQGSRMDSDRLIDRRGR